MRCYTSWLAISQNPFITFSSQPSHWIYIYQSMAWLLHESRLQGEIPMFCIVGIRPLLCNNKTTISVSVGAIKLLAHLHSRLEVSSSFSCISCYVVVLITCLRKCLTSYFNNTSLSHLAGPVYCRGRLCTGWRWRYVHIAAIMILLILNTSSI